MATPKQTTTVTEALKKAIALQQAGAQQAAEQIYRQILAVQPQQSDALHNLGLLVGARDGAPQALPLLRAALEAKPAVGQYWLSYAQWLLRDGQADGAWQILQQGSQQGLAGDKLEHLRAQVAQVRASKPDLLALQSLEQAGDYAELEAEATRQIERFGRLPELVHKCAVAQLQLGKNPAALAGLREVQAAWPDDINVWNQLGLVLCELGQHDEAHQCYQKALALAPDTVSIHTNISVNLCAAGRFEEAVAVLQAALTQDPAAFKTRLALANALWGQQKTEEAQTWIEALLAEGHRGTEVLMPYARILSHLDTQDSQLKAEQVMREVLQAQPEHHEVLLALAGPLVDQGQFAEAGALIERVLAVRPNSPQAWAKLPHLRKMTEEDAPWLTRAQEILAAGVSDKEAIGLLFAMGKCCDDLRRFDEAFAYYARANTIKQKFCQPYDRTSMEQVTTYLQQGHGPAVVQRKHPGANPSDRPLFIVGMPRSGTSLTEQILASHPQTFGAGELRFWKAQMDAYKRQYLMADYAPQMLEGLSGSYLQLLQQYSTDALRVVDKIPSNFQMVGLIHAAFPNARILHTVRNPVDTCLSIYFQNFNLGHKYANDLDDIAHYYRQYHRLMAHWRQVLPQDVFLELPYEQLVEDQEGWSRRIIEFVGLEWDERCLAFYKTERKVGTASNWQARQPIYKTSKERWRNYEQHVGPLLPLLELYDPARGQL